MAVRGFMTYGSQSNFNLGMDAKNVRIRYPEGIRSVLSGNLGLSGSFRKLATFRPRLD